MRVHVSSRALAAFVAVLASAMLVPATPIRAQLSTPLGDDVLSSFRWRSVGPANISGRVSDIEGIGSPSKTFFVAAAGGGIWKTTNNGITFRPVFDVGRVISMGDLAIAPSDTMQVWAGTGEGNSRNSISPGGGIYKSTDGGLTWELKGLEATQVIARVLVHPTNPDIVYAAALGHIWDSNPERGVYKTVDGGETWQLKKFISDKAGFVDMVFDPRDPQVLFAASWERVRGPWFLNSGGPGSGLWKTTDGGESWTEIVGNGFPTAMKGRIGLAISPSDPDVIYALTEAEAEEDGTGGSGLYRSADGGTSWEKMNDIDTRPFYYSQVRVDPVDPDRVYFSSTPVRYSNDGGRTSGNATVGIHVDQHAMWIDPNDPDHFITGNDGGIAQTWDRGGNFEFLNTIAIGQFYDVSYNMDVPYRVCGGLQDNGTWCGPSRRTNGSITNAMWATIGGGDGFVSAQHPLDPDIVIVESQGGSMSRTNTRTGQRSGLQRPSWRDRYLEFEDSILVVWDDDQNEPPAEAKARIERFREMQRSDSASKELRWNWNTPLFLSTHDPNVLYAGANRVLKSTRLGDDLEVISPDLSTQDPNKIAISTQTTGGITRDVTGAETHATIVALAESPLVQGMLFAGTDDGNVWMSPDDGGEWVSLTPRFHGLVPDSTYVSRIEPSRVSADRFYITFDNHRRNDFTPYVFVTEDGGDTFRSISAGLPTDGPGFVHVIREDPFNPNLLFVGTDLGVWASTDRGAVWQRFMEGLPTVPVRDLRVHPRDRELIAATHGRSIWIVDVAPLEQMSDARMAEGAMLFEPAPALQFGSPPVGGESTGQQVFRGENRRYGAALTYYLPERAEGQQLEITITDAAGKKVATVNGSTRAGMNTALWNFRGPPPPRAALSPAARRDSLKNAQMMKELADSLVEHEGADRAQMDQALQLLASGGRGFRGGFGGGRGGPPTGFQERPGEGPIGAASGRGGGGGGGGPGGNAQRQLFTALRDRGVGFQRAFRRGGGAQGALAAPGTYTASMTVNGRTLSAPLVVTRQDGFEPAGAGPFGEDAVPASWDELFEWLNETRTGAGG